MLPAIVKTALASGKWRAPTEKERPRWESVFCHGLGRDAVHVWSDEEAGRMTSYLRSHPEEFGKELQQGFKRSSATDDKMCEPDLTRCVVIADFCWVPHVGDRVITPVALEMFEDNLEGRVVCYPDNPFELYWVEIAPSFTELLRLLAIAQPSAEAKPGRVRTGLSRLWPFSREK